MTPIPARQPHGEPQQREDAPAPARSSKATRNAGLTPRDVRRVVGLSRELDQLDDVTRDVLVGVLGVTGRDRHDTVRLTVAVMTGDNQAATTVLDALDRAVAETDPVERVISLIELADDIRARMWRLLSALGHGGAGSPGDATTAAKKIIGAIRHLEDEDRELISAVRRLASGR